MLGHKINISKKFITKLLNLDDSRKRYFDMLAKKDKMDTIVGVIFQDGKTPPMP